MMRKLRVFFRGAAGKWKGLKLWKKLLLLAVLAVVVVLLVLWVRGRGRSLPVGAMGQQMGTRTVTLQKSSITESVSVTGMVESTGVTNVTASANYKVTEILAQEGDTVTEGQVLARLDTEDLQEQISKKKQSMAENIAKAQKAYDEAVTTCDEAHAAALNSESGTATAKSAYDEALAKFNTAKSSVASLQTAYDNELNGELAGGAQLNSAEAALAVAKANLDSAEAAAAQNPENAELAAARDVSKEAYNAALTVRDDAQRGYDTAVTLRKSAEEALNSAKATCNYDALEKACTAAQQAYESARKSLDSLESSYKNALKNVETTKDSLASASKSDEIDELQKALEDCVVTAPGSGTITAVNATVGSAPAANTALFVIQDTQHLKVSVTIDEYDIKTVQTGMRAVIKSDATGETEIAGTVSQISLTSGSAGGTSGTSTSGFGAEITVDGTDSGLLIGMSAKVEIILSEKENVYSVPYDAVGKNENGESVVYVQQGNEFVPVVVTTGLETDYYIEISGADLSEGDVIRASADESSVVGAAEGEAESTSGPQMGFSVGGAMPAGNAAMPAGGQGGMPQGGGQGGPGGRG